MADTIDNNNVTGLSPSTPTKRSLTELNQPQTEKPFHYTYLKEFRVEQCQLFLQHKCTQHRPFTCFYWHFLNQRRRRPKRKKDGTFNYSPDVYCTFYNETSGECPHGDDCPYLHRVAGDVERRYHLRYYKTSPCVHETDARGYCVKNGPHCAFAHGPHDLRQPVYDVRELQAMEQEEKEGESKQIVPEDPRWNDTTYVLANYKTEPCKKPPRLCRQGYACPQYHNNRDRRRSPRKYKYRSTPCPNVKHGDEWGDPNGCENGDACAYCHTRTEQQFHPEIYKSTKCNDMQQTGHCPRGPFCAFAHVEQDGIAVMNTVLKSGSISIIPDKELLQRGLSSSSQHSSMGESPLASPASHQPGGPRPFRSSSTSATVVQYSSVTEHGTTCVPGPLSSSAPTYEKAPGSGRRSGSITSKDLDQHASFSSPPLGPLNLNEPRTPTTSDVSHFYPPSNTIESVVDHALGEFHFDDFDVSELEKELNEPSSLGSSLGGTTPIGGFNSLGSDPVSIPGNPHDTRHQSFTSQPSQSPTSPIGQVPPHFHHQHSNPAGYIRSPTGRGSQSSSFFDGVHMQSPKLPTPQLTSPLGLSSSSDLHRLSDENMSLRNKLASWEESWNQAKQACDAWKREANEQFEKAKQIDREKTQALIKLGEAEAGMRSLQHEIETRHGGPHIRVLKSVPELENLPLIELKQILNQLKVDIERLEKVPEDFLPSE